jgi:hypothetical protein
MLVYWQLDLNSLKYCLRKILTSFFFVLTVYICHLSCVAYSFIPSKFKNLCNWVKFDNFYIKTILLYLRLVDFFCIDEVCSLMMISDYLDYIFFSNHYTN